MLVQVLNGTFLWLTGVTSVVVVWAGQQADANSILTIITGTGGSLVLLYLGIRYMAKLNEKKEARIEALQLDAISHRDEIIKQLQADKQKLNERINELQDELHK